MQYFYIETSKGDIIGSFDTKAQALQYADYAALEEGWKLLEGNKE
jgi:hypothetical protein